VPRLTGAKVALNVDGLEWQRRKWGSLGRAYYRFCSWLAPKLAILLVSDARVIADYFRERYRKRTAYIPYGTDARRLEPGSTLKDLGLEPNRYLLYVSRLEPENNAHVVIDAYDRSGLDMPLVVVGDAPYASKYKERLHAMAPPGVLFLGYIFGTGYVELQSNALLYIQAKEVGGTAPALVEAMGRGVPVIANDVPAHREVLASAGAYYVRNSPEDLAQQMRVLAVDADLRRHLGQLAHERARTFYSWEHVTDEYERLFRSLLGSPAEGDLRLPSSAGDSGP
jgi:glycosyltransferase involved in cell wall biosynthesis